MTQTQHENRPLFLVSSAGSSSSVANYAQETVVPFVVERGYQAAHFNIPSDALYERDVKGYGAALREGLARFGELLPRSAGFLLVNAVAGGRRLLDRDFMGANPALGRTHAALHLIQAGMAQGVGVDRFAIDAGTLYGTGPESEISRLQLQATGIVDLAGDLHRLPVAQTTPVAAEWQPTGTPPGIGWK